MAGAFPTIVNEACFGTNGGSVGYTGRVNDYAGATYRSGPRVPLFFVGWILKKIGTLTGVAVDGDFFQHPEWSQLLLVNMREAEGTDIEVRNHLPDLGLVDFLLELRKVPNLKLTLDPVGRRLRVDFWEDALAAPVTRDWTAKAVVGQSKKSEPNTRLSLSMALDGNDALAKDRPAALADWTSPETGSRGGIAKLPLNFSTLLVDDASGLAACRQEGQTSQFGQDAKGWCAAAALLARNGGGIAQGAADAGRLRPVPGDAGRDELARDGGAVGLDVLPAKRPGSERDGFGAARLCEEDPHRGNGLSDRAA